MEEISWQFRSSNVRKDLTPHLRSTRIWMEKNSAFFLIFCAGGKEKYRVGFPGRSN